MLEGLDNVDWGKLGAAQAPILLRELASADEGIRWAAQSTFGKQILLMESSEDEINLRDGVEVFESDLFFCIIPFLIELLTTEIVKDKYWLLDFLHFMAEYVDYVKESHPVFERVKAIRAAVWAHYEIYFSFLWSDESENRRAAVTLLTEYTEHAAELLPRFRQLIEATKDVEESVNILWDVNSNLLRNTWVVWAKKPSLFPNGDTDVDVPDEFTTFLENLVITAEAHEMRITAAITLANIMRDRTPSHIIHYIVKTLTNTSDDMFPSNRVHTLFASTQAKALIRLGPRAGIPAAIQVVDRTNFAENCFQAFVAALILAFDPHFHPYHYGVIPSWQRGELRHYTVSIEPSLDNWPEPYHVPFPNLNALNASQEAVLEAAVRNDCVWAIESNVFDVFGLPNQREELAEALL